MESSVHSFLLTVKRIYDYLYDTSHAIDDFISTGANNLNEMPDLSDEADEFDYDDQNTDFFNVGKKVKIRFHILDQLSRHTDNSAYSRNLSLPEDSSPSINHFDKKIHHRYH